MFNKINLMHIVCNLYPFAGMERKVIQLLNSLDPEKYKSTIVALEEIKPESHAFIRKDIELIELNKQPGVQFNLCLKLAHILREKHIDIIHSHNWATLFHAVIAGRIAGINTIIHGEHGRESSEIRDGFKSRLLKKLLYGLSHKLVAVTPAIEDLLINNYGIRPSKVFVIKNGVDLDRYQENYNKDAIIKEFNLSGLSPIIGTVGRVKPVKDFKTLIAAFATVSKKYKNAGLVIVGPDNVHGDAYYQELLVQIRELGIQDQVRFLGKIEDIPRILSIMDIYVNSSVTEGMSNTILEAMVAKKCIVASNVGGNPGLISDEYTGLLFEAKDVKQLSDKLAQVIEDENSRKNLADNANDYALMEHNIDRMFSMNEYLYKEWHNRKHLKHSSVSGSVKKMMSHISYFSGIQILLRKSGSKFNIINFHRIVPEYKISKSANPAMMVSPENFERIIEMISKYFYPITLNEAVQIHKNGGKYPEKAMVITFDDGYLDNYKFAFPVLQKYQVPATIFLATGFIENDRYFWWDEVEWFFKNYNTTMMELTDRISKRVVESVQNIQNSRNGRESNGVYHLIRLLNKVDVEERTKFITIMQSYVRDQKPKLLMDWKHIIAMQKSGLVEYGAHTVNHVYVDELSVKELLQEVSDSVRTVEQKTGNACKHFAYPAGRITSQAANAIADAGIESAVTTEFGTNHKNIPVMQLKRKDSRYFLVDNKFSQHHFSAVECGLYDRLHN